MSDLEPITRAENFWVNEGDLEPITRKEQYIKHLYDETQVVPEYPKTREEYFINKAGEELHDVTVEQLNVTENGTYSEAGKAYSPVIVEVPEPTLITKSITANGTYTASSDNADGYSSVDVNVEGYKISEVSGLPSAIATFSDASALPMPKLKVAVEPQQEGSGDPSPTNIRPISGWSAVDVTVCGKNLFDKTATDTNKGFIFGKWINQTGNTFIYGDWSVSEYIRVDGEKIAVSGMTVAEQVSSGRGGYCCYDKYKNVLGGGTYNALTQIITLPTNTEYIRISVWNQNKDVCQLELSETAATYEPYAGTTYTIDLDGTRYGGTLDVVSGVLTVDKGYVDLGDLNWTYSNGFFRTADLNSLIKKPVNNNTKVNAISSMYVAEMWNTISSTNNGKFAVSAGTRDPLIVCNAEYTDATAFKQAMNGVQLVYELATPIEVQLTPTAVKSLLGTNNLSADTGDVVEASYFESL